MQATDNDQVIERYLNEMLQRIGDGNANLLEVKEQISNLQITYQAEREAAKKDPSKEKAFERYQEALAGALPGVAKGTLESISAFQKSPPDVIVGSAAVMDVCASLASTLGGLTAAGGPPGALLGALFSTVSMILRFFAPQPPSLLSQIEEMMRTLKAETVASQIEAAKDAVLVYIEVCDKYMPPVEKDKPVPDPTRLTELVNDLNLIRGDEIWTIREVRKWLDEPKNQTRGLAWDLNLVCQVYMFLMLALTRQNSMRTMKKGRQIYRNSPAEQEWRLLQEQRSKACRLAQ